jgi:hypothetical protein
MKLFKVKLFILYIILIALAMMDSKAQKNVISSKFLSDASISIGVYDINKLKDFKVLRRKLLQGDTVLAKQEIVKLKNELSEVNAENYIKYRAKYVNLNEDISVADYPKYKNVVLEILNSNGVINPNYDRRLTYLLYKYCLMFFSDSWYISSAPYFAFSTVFVDYLMEKQADQLYSHYVHKGYWSFQSYLDGTIVSPKVRDNYLDAEPTDRELEYVISPEKVKELSKRLASIKVPKDSTLRSEYEDFKKITDMALTGKYLLVIFAHE